MFSCGVGRGGTAIPLMWRDSDRVGCRASGENQALRGVSVRVHDRYVGATLSATILRRDARLDTAGRVISLPESGRHVSEVELEGKTGSPGH